MFRVLFFTLLTLGTFKAQALEIAKGCRDLSALQNAWETKYFYDFKFDKRMQSPVQLTCNSPLYILIKALWFLENAKTSQSGYFYNLTKQNTTSMIMLNKRNDDVHDTICAGADSTSVVGQMEFYPCFFQEFTLDRGPLIDSYFNLVLRVTAIVHETRHLQLKERAKHVKCAKSGLERACDHAYSENLSDAGAYSFEVIYLKDVLANNQLDPSLKVAIEELIQAQLTHKFNN